MAYKRFRRYGRYAKRGLKNRYIPRSKGKGRRLNVTNLVRDVAKLKYSLNSETKFIQTNLSTMSPLATTPLIQELSTPDTIGSQSNERVGSKVKFCHLSGKLQVLYQNFGNVTANNTLTIHIIWLKNGLFASELEGTPGNYLMNPDFNNEFGELSYFNQQNYNSWVSVYKYKCTMSDLQPPSQAAYGLQTDQDGNNTDTNLGRQPQTQTRYININKRITIHTEWGNPYNTSPGVDDETITRMKPYIYVTSNCSSQSTPIGVSQPTGLATDRMFLQGSLRLSYKDN